MLAVSSIMPANLFRGSIRRVLLAGLMAQVLPLPDDEQMLLKVELAWIGKALLRENDRTLPALGPRGSREKMLFSLVWPHGSGQDHHHFTFAPRRSFR